VVAHGARLPGWLAGSGPTPPIAAPAGWALAVAILIVLPWLLSGRAGDEKASS
jgi:hypothetical protein